MGVEEVTKAIKVIITPDPDGEEGEYWVHTLGMDQFERKEIEFRFVFFPWALEACRRLNTLAVACIKEPFELLSEVVIDEDTPFPTRYEVQNTEHEYWDGHPFGCVTLVPVMDCARCTCCDKEERPKLTIVSDD